MLPLLQVMGPDVLVFYDTQGSEEREGEEGEKKKKR